MAKTVTMAKLAKEMCGKASPRRREEQLPNAMVGLGKVGCGSGMVIPCNAKEWQLFVLNRNGEEKQCIDLV